MRSSAARSTVLVVSCIALACAAPSTTPRGVRGTHASLSRDERRAVEGLNVSTIDEFTRRLTDRALEGRGAGQRGGLEAARLIAGAFRAAGLRPLPGSPDVLQEVPVEFSTISPDSRLSVNGKDLRYGSDFVFSAFDMGHAPATSETVEGDVVFVGYGITDTVLGRDDLAGLDIRGKIAVVLGGLPRGVTYARAMRVDDYAVTANLARRGARAILHLRQGLDPTTVAYGTRRHGTLHQVPAGYPQKLPPAALVRAATLLPLFDAAGLDLPKLVASLDSGGVVSAPLPGRIALSIVRVREPSVATANVIGFVEGSDPERRNDAVVLTAHYDAYGIDARGTVFPGAGDNALKVGMLVSLAEAIVKAKPRRSVIFAATTAHETSFLLGSFHMANAGAWPVERMAAVVNLDGIGSEAWGPLFMMHAMAGDQTTADTTVRDLGRRFGLRIEADELTSSRIFQRSDHFEFVRRGVPSIYLVGYPAVFDSLGARFGRTFSQVVHFPGDTIETDWHWRGAHEFARFHLLLVLRLASADGRPEWVPGSPLGIARGQRLH